MRTLRRFVKRLSFWTKAAQDEERLRDEIEDHLARQTSDNIHAGMTPIEARREAVLKFGAVEAMRETYRDYRGLPSVETLLRDVRHALRRVGKNPAFTVTTVLTLALGIGATTSIFTLVYAVLLKSLAVANPDQLYRLGKEARCCYWTGYSQDKEFSLVSYDLYKSLRDNTQGFIDLAAFPAVEPLFGVRRQGTSEAAQSYPGEFVSGNYFATFGIRAYAGRTLTTSDDRAGAPPVALMSYRLWQQKYGSDPSVIGSIFEIDKKPFAIAGITPPGFFGDTLRPTPPDFFLLLNTEPLVESDGDLYKINTHWLELMGRIKPGARAASIEAQMRVELKTWLSSHWTEMSSSDRAEFPIQTLFLRPGGAGISSMREEYEHWLQILMLVTGFVLLIACANVANLMIVRGMEGRRQTSLSMALGARPSRLIRQALTESILLALMGGVAGVAIAFAGTRLILYVAFPRVGEMASIPIEASPSTPVLLFAFAMSLITGVAFGIAPAWMATRVDPIEALRGAGRSTARTGSLARKTLVVLQAALSLILLSSSGLLTTVLHKLEHQNLGFDQNRRMVANVEPRLAGYRPEQLTLLYRRIRGSLESIPGVEAAALCTYSPQNMNQWGGAVWVDGHPASGSDQDNLAFWDRVTPGYFDVIGNPIIRGRGISEQDTANSRRVAVINEAFARKYFKDQNPIGRHFGRGGIGSERQYEIVGVARDIRNLTYSLEKPTGPFYFLPEAQHDFPPNSGAGEISPGSHFAHDLIFVTRPGASVSLAQVRRALAAVDPNLPVIAMGTVEEQIGLQFSQQRLMARLTSFFGVLSIILASIGIYGVTAYNAGQRTNEIGLRMALGAHRRQILTLVLGSAFALVLLGLLIGLPLTFAAGRVLGNQLYGMDPYSPTVTAIAVAALGLCTLVASLVPAVRAASISPLEALRSD